MKKIIYTLLVTLIATTSVFAFSLSVSPELRIEIYPFISWYIESGYTPYIKTVAEVKTRPEYYDKDFLENASDEDILVFFPTDNTKALIYSPSLGEVTKSGSYNYFSTKYESERILTLLSKHTNLPTSEQPIVGKISQEDWDTIAKEEGEEFTKLVKPGNWLIEYPESGEGYIYDEEKDEILAKIK